MPSRRAWLSGCAAAAASAAAGRAWSDEPSDANGADRATRASLDLDVRDVRVAGDRKLGRRFTLFVPRNLAAGERVPLLVLLHGRGETGDERSGVFAWLERYGLGTAYDRLRRPPVARTSKRPDLTDERAGAINEALGRRAFRGLVIACPYTPDVPRLPDPARALDDYARWIGEVVVPTARREAPAASDARSTRLDGCSLGGYVGLEVFLRRPDLFGGWGGVQSAFGEHRAASYAERLARALADAGPRDLHLLSSTQDPFLGASRQLARELARRKLEATLAVAPGPHDQPWLREIGTLEMLLWHDAHTR